MLFTIRRRLAVSGAAVWFASTVFLVAQNSAPTATPPSGDPLRSLGLPALAATQATMWAERTDPRQPLVVSLTIAFGTSSSGGPAVAWPALLTSTIQVDADADGQASPGDTLRYHLQISNATGSPLTNLVASLPVDSHTNAIVSSLNVSPIALDGTATTNADTPAPITAVGTDADRNGPNYTIVFPP